MKCKHYKIAVYIAAFPTMCLVYGLILAVSVARFVCGDKWLFSWYFELANKSILGTNI
jgi:hypothetical protein